MTLVDDLSHPGSLSPEFDPRGIWMIRTTSPGQVYLFAQLRDGFPVQYSVTFGQPAPPLKVLGPIGTGADVGLIDVAPAARDPAAGADILLSYTPSTGPQMGNALLRVIPVARAFDAGAAPAFSVGDSVGTGVVFGGRLLVAEGGVDYLLSIVDESGLDDASAPIDTIVAGRGGAADGSATEQTLASLAFPLIRLSQTPFFELDGGVFAFVEGLSDQANESEVVFPSDFLSPGLWTNLTPPGLVEILGAQPSAVAPGKADVILVFQSAAGAPYQITAAQLAPPLLSSLQIRFPPFVLGSSLTAQEVPFSAKSSSWMDDELVVVGMSDDLSGGIVLLWVGPDGRVVARGSGLQKLVSRVIAPQSTAVQFAEHQGELTATIDVAWVDRVGDDAGGTFDRLFAAQAKCAPAGAGAAGD
jgi:hypothetical protein